MHIHKILKGILCSTNTFWNSMDFLLCQLNGGQILHQLQVQIGNCGGTGIYTTIPTNTVQVSITPGTVMDSGSVYTGLLGALSSYRVCIQDR